MLASTWRETEYSCDVCRATDGAHIDIYWAQKEKTLWGPVFENVNFSSTPYGWR
jgi:hypothetical protein